MKKCKKKQIILAALVHCLLCSGLAFGNPVWLSSKPLHVQAGQSIVVYAGFGHFFPKSRFGYDEAEPFEHDGILYLKAIHPSGKQEDVPISPHLDGSNLALAAFTPKEEGYYVFYSENNGMYSTRTDDGKLLRKSKEDAQNSGKVVIKSVLQKTFMKTIVSVGKAAKGSQKKEVGAEFEFIPLSDMQSLKTGGYAKLKLICQGKPLGKARINFRFTGESKVGKESREYYFTTITSSRGIARIKIYNRGSYLVSSEKFIKTPQSKQHTEKRLRAVIIFEVP